MYHYHLPWFKKKQLFLPKNLTLKAFRLQMAGYNAGRKEIIYHSRLFTGSWNLWHQRWLMPSRKRLFQVFFQTMKDMKDIHNGDEFGVFLSVPSKWNLPAEVKKRLSRKAKESYPCSSLGRLKILDASKMSSFHLVATEINEKVWWMRNCLKSGSESWTVSVLLKEEMLFCNIQLPIPFSYWQLKSNQIVFPTT